MTDILAELKRLNAERTRGEFPWHYDDEAGFIFTQDEDNGIYYDHICCLVGFKDLNANGKFIAAMANHATALIEIAEAGRALRNAIVKVMDFGEGTRVGDAIAEFDRLNAALETK